ncbi:hypothetical protein IGI04_013372 [Brassica rapa subsp. trilocularis]|uniref:Uncharacterized protein n=1 Tax=Brassica rapa subsp. trilocularis TaxID=1813537 RepID=A0ABQ7N8P5_BRACM|nr:hypothetical protein IGI04_013372 [Brassica rapa subsp. trilocularis]
MGSSFFGRPKMGGSSSSSPTSSSPAKRGKNKNGSDKPKQPQRGLGDDVRSQGEYPSIPYSSSSVHYGIHPNMMMNASNDQYERTTTRYIDAQPYIAPSWNPNYGILESQHFVEPNTTRHFLHEDPRNNSFGSDIENFQTSDATEPDLELRLSL